MSKSKYRGILNKDLKLLALSDFIGAFGDGLYFYLFPLYITTLEAGPAEVGIVYSVLYFAAAFAPLVGGFLADKYDRKKVLLLGWLIWIPIPLIFSVAEHWSQLLVGAVLYGFWVGGPAASAYIATSAKKDKITLTFTLISAAWWAGYIFSPALGGYLSTIIGMRWVTRLAFILYVLSAGVLLFMSSQHAVAQSSTSPSSFSSLRTKKMVVWSLFFALLMIVTVLARPFIPQFLQGTYSFDEFQIGILGSVTFLGSALLGLGLGRIGDRWRKPGAISVAVILCCTSFIALISFGNFFALALASFLIGVSYAIPSLIDAIVGSIAPEVSRGRWLSIPQTLSMLAAFLAPYLGGILYSASPYSPFMVAIIITPILSILALSKPLKEEI
ncbi:MAG: MFS transporter [Candidatus Bathyarchaeota archaeon]|nr:MFS transporter [Candidatus Bathyarchaeota archaeon]